MNELITIHRWKHMFYTYICFKSVRLIFKFKFRVGFTWWELSTTSIVHCNNGTLPWLTRVWIVLIITLMSISNDVYWFLFYLHLWCTSNASQHVTTTMGALLTVETVITTAWRCSFMTSHWYTASRQHLTFTQKASFGVTDCAASTTCTIRTSVNILKK